MASLLVLIYLPVIAVIIYVILYYINVRRYPKGPIPLPLIGNLHQVKVENFHLELERLAEKYGNCFTLFIPKPIVVLSDYSHIKEALLTQGGNFDHRSQLPPESLFQRTTNTGVLFSDGEVWQTQRRTAIRIFRDFGMGKNIMEQQVSRSVKELLEQLGILTKNESVVDIGLPIQLCVGNIINETLFGFHFPYTDTRRFEEYAEITANNLYLLRHSVCTLLLQAFPWMACIPYVHYHGAKVIRDNIERMHVIMEEEIAKVKELYDPEEEPTNFIEAYLQEIHKGTPGLDLTNLEAVATDFWVAGMETTATTTRWALLYLMKHPDVQDKLYDELLQVVGKVRLPEMADKPNLPYFNAFIHEVQRCANIVPLLLIHKCIEDRQLFEHVIPSGTWMFPQIFSVLKHDEMFEDPEEFRPERFLDSNGKISKPMVDRLIAFGMGRRSCAGESLARMELFLILSSLVQQYFFSPVGPIDMTAQYGVVCTPRPFKCRMVPRE